MVSIKCNLISFYRPSLHQSFDDTEDEERISFEEAEMYGRTDGDCDIVYGKDCDISPLHAVTDIIEQNIEEIF